MEAIQAKRSRGRPPKEKGPLAKIDNMTLQLMFYDIATHEQTVEYGTLLYKGNKGAATSYASRIALAEWERMRMVLRMYGLS